MTKKTDTYQLITNKILELLDKGVIPWRKPWGGPSDGPKSLQSMNPYSGINSMLLNCAPYGSRYWTTYREAQKYGGHVRKGEKGWPVVYWGKGVKNKGENTERLFMFLKHFTVFNLEQCEGMNKVIALTEKTKPSEFVPIEACKQVVNDMPHTPNLSHGGDRACYSPSFDKVTMPNADRFSVPEEYYSTLFHELVHATGHSSRLNRDGVAKINHFGSHEYSKEELVAEFGAAFLCGHCNIDTTIKNSAAYIQSWSRKLKEDKRLVVQAAGKGQKATSYILNNQGQNSD